MKKICTLACLLILSQFAIAQKATKLSFDLVAKTLAIDGKLTALGNQQISLNVKKGAIVVFEVLPVSGKTYQFILNTLTLTNSDFKNGTIQTDAALTYKGVSLSPEFKVSIPSPHIIQGFKIATTKKDVKTDPKATKSTKQAAKTPDDSSDPAAAVATPKANTSKAYQPGYSYYDAFAIKNYKTISPGLLDSILANYSAGSLSDEKSVDATINGNPFWSQSLKDALIARVTLFFHPKTTEDSIRAGLVEAHGLGGMVTKAVSSVGGFDVTTIADGVSRFLIKRGKQELSIAFFNKFKDVLNKKGNQDIRILFPNTVNLLNEIDQEIYNYDSYLQNLREAFKKDITLLPKDLPGIIDSNQAYFKQHQMLAGELLGACYLANELENHTHPGDIIANFPDSLLDKFSDTAKKKYYFKGAFQTIQLISRSLQDSTSGENDPYWVNTGKVRKLITDDDAFNIYLGLLYQRTINMYGTIQFDSDHNLKNFFDTLAPVITADNIKAYKAYILGMSSRIDAINKMISQQNSQPSVKSDSATVEKYANYVKTVADLLNYCSSVSDLPWKSNSTIGKELKINFRAEFAPYFDITNHTADLAIDVVKKNYSAAINEVAYVYNKLKVKPVLMEVPAAAPKDAAKMAQDVNSQIKKLEKITKKTLPDNLSAKVKASLEAEAPLAAGKADSLKKAADTSKNNMSILIKYATFMASVSTAKNSSDVENAIEAAALPPGSYSVKQKSSFNVSLNAYVGYAFDFKRLDVSYGLHASGIYAPIGFSFSKGMWGSSPSRWPKFTVFASLIDLGNLVSYRLQNGMTDSLKQQVRLESIFSPSLQLIYNVPNLPLSVAAGWRRTPKLFYSGQSTFRSETPKSVFNLSVLIDIPIFTLYNKRE